MGSSHHSTGQSCDEAEEEKKKSHSQIPRAPELSRAVLESLFWDREMLSEAYHKHTRKNFLSPPRGIKIIDWFLLILCHA